MRGNGDSSLEKYTHDPGIDPLYLAMFEYDDETVLAKVVDTFGLVPHDGDSQLVTLTETIPDELTWFPLSHATEIYVFPAGEHEYTTTLWVDENRRVGIIERTWW